MQKEKRETQKHGQLLFAFLLALIALFFLLFVLHIHVTWTATVNSDDASELILAKKLSEEGGILSRTWYYSTELRVLNTQLIFAPLFLLTDNWHTVRVAGAAILVALLAMSAALLGRALQLGRTGAALLALTVIVPFSLSYYNFVLFRSYYIPHIVISFVTLAAVLTLPRLREQKRRGRWLLLNAAVSLLALVAGMGGLRQLLVLYMPLLLTAVVQSAFEWRVGANVAERGRLSGWTVELLAESTLLMLFAGLGFLVNVVLLHKTYAYVAWGNLRFAPFSPGRLADVFNGLLNNLGYLTGRELFSPALLFNAVCALVMLALIAALVDTHRDPTAGRGNKTMAEVFLSALAVMGALYGFSDMEYADRYVLPVTVLMLPVVVSWLCRKRAGQLLRLERAAITAGLVLFFTVSAVNYGTLSRGGNSDLNNLAQALRQQGFRSGYATFWNGNVLTELANGELELWVLSEDFPQTGDTGIISPWLQSADHLSAPEGEVFCVFSADQWDTPTAKRLEGAELLYESDGYRAYGFPSAEALAAAAAGTTEPDPSE